MNKLIGEGADQGCILRQVTLDALQCTENVVSKDRQINTQYDVTDYRDESDVILGIYLSILGDDISRTLECIVINQPYIIQP